jgi:hypothetical protein
MNDDTVVLTAGVEGIVDEVLLRRLCRSLHVKVGQVYGRGGKSYLLSRIAGYNYSAQFRHWLVLVDLDSDAECVPKVLPQWLPNPSRLMSLRVAVRQLESWLLADPERIASYLSVPVGRIPSYPDTIPDPKRFIVELARTSRRRAIREDIAPMSGSGQSTGPAYTSRMIEFIQDKNMGWRPEEAIRNSNSLDRCRRAILELIKRPYEPT